MLNSRCVARSGLVTFLWLCALLPALTAAPQKGGMERFDAEDPYTRGESELVEKLGYARLGHGPWHGGEDTKALQRNLGGIDMLFVETTHFRVASSLGTYAVPNNREERARIKEELKRLEQKLGRLKAPKNELDPWLRLHLYAQRAEDQYAAFLEEFGLTSADFAESGPHLGYPDKFLLVLCQRKSEFGRYVRHYHDSTLEVSYRTCWPGDTMVAAVSFEALKDGRELERELPADTILHNMVATTLTANFLEGYHGSLVSAPQWFVSGLSHSHLRRIDPHWNLFDGREDRQGDGREQWDWEPRVYNLVKNKFFAEAEAMFAWKTYEELDQRDHLVSWSKTEFLLNELEGDKKAFLGAICSAAGAPGENDKPFVARQEAALKAYFGLTPGEFDRAWSRWVLKTYRKR